MGRADLVTYSSTGDKDIKAGLAVRNKTTGQVRLRSLPPQAVRVFLGDDEKHNKMKSLSLSKVDQELLDLAVHEFVVRDFSEIRDEGILKFIPLLRSRMPTLFRSSETAPHRYPSPRLGLEPTYPPAPDIIADACVEAEEGAATQPTSQRWREAVTRQLNRDEPPLLNTYRLSYRSFIVHLHIPKTGGTNFNLQLKAISKAVQGKYCEVLSTSISSAVLSLLLYSLIGPHHRCPSHPATLVSWHARRVCCAQWGAGQFDHLGSEQSTEGVWARQAQALPPAIPCDHNAEGPYRSNRLSIRAPLEPREVFGCARLVAEAVIPSIARVPFPVPPIPARSDGSVWSTD